MRHPNCLHTAALLALNRIYLLGVNPHQEFLVSQTLTAPLCNISMTCFSFETKNTLSWYTRSRPHGSNPSRACLFLPQPAFACPDLLWRKAAIRQLHRATSRGTLSRTHSGAWATGQPQTVLSEPGHFPPGGWPATASSQQNTLPARSEDRGIFPRSLPTRARNHRQRELDASVRSDSAHTHAHDSR